MELDEAEQIALAKALEAITSMLAELRDSCSDHSDRILRLEMDRARREGHIQ